MLILNSGYRQVTNTPNKQEQSTPKGANLLTSLLSVLNIGGIRIERDKSRKLYIQKVRMVGGRQPGAVYTPAISCLLSVSY